MAIRCPQCKREYDVTLFEFDKTVECVCGSKVSLQHRELLNILIDARKDENKRTNEIKKLADKIAFLIVSTDYPKIDLEIEKQKLRDRIYELFPDRAHLYELIYEPRFRRLEKQFREKP